jgi:hypothetical protein
MASDALLHHRPRVKWRSRLSFREPIEEERYPATRPLDLVLSVGGTRYVTGHGAADYLDHEAFEAAFDKRNIDSRPFFSRLSSLPAFRDRPAAKRFATPTDRGAKIAEFGVNLPSGYNMTEDLVDVVCAALREIVAARR